MSGVLTRDAVFTGVDDLASAGAALHWLRPKSKAPYAKDWSDLPRNSIEDLKRSYSDGANVGIRLGAPSETILGYIYLIDLDIREDAMAGDALAILRNLWPEFAQAPTVISGSGGESRHFYFITDKLFRSKKLAKSKTFKMVWDEQKGREVKKNDWEIELFGTGKQAVIPPSIHPDTGLPYRWLTKPDLSFLDLGMGPTVPASLVESWGARVDSFDGDDEDDDEWLMSVAINAKLGLEDDEISEIMANLPEDWVDDRDGWRTVGMALHHEFDGDEEGFQRWCEWSQQSDKFDADDQRKIWASFKGSKTPVRMATLKAEAARKRFADNMPIEDDEDTFGEPAIDITPDPLDDLLGGESKGELVSTQDQMLAELLGDSSSAVTQPEEQELVLVRKKPPAQEDWKSCLALNADTSMPLNTMPNSVLIVRNDTRTRGVIAMNRFTEQIVQIAEPGIAKLQKAGPKPVVQLDSYIWKLEDPLNGDVWTDDHDVGVRMFLEAPNRQGGYDMKVSDRDLRAAVSKAALENQFHPVKEFLTMVQWDGVPRMDTLFIDYLGCPDTPYHRETARKFLLGAVSRIFEPGCKYDFVPVLEGSQGVRKSTFISVLGGRWTGELGDVSDEARMFESMRGAWIMEMPELQGMRKADVNNLKAFITLQVDKRRLPYERHPREFPRQSVFIGSTNESAYLRDFTGNRRYWPIKVDLDGGVIDIDRLNAHVKLIWAEVVEVYREMRKAQPFGDLPLYLQNPESVEEAETLQGSRQTETVESSMAGELEAWLDTPAGSEFDDMDGVSGQVRDTVCLKEIWVEMLGRDPGSYNNRDAAVLSTAMRLLDGWHQPAHPRTTKYGRQRVYVRKGSAADFVKPKKTELTPR